MRIKKEDKKNAKSLVESSEREMKFTLSLPVSEESSSTIVRNIYECFRKLGDALLISKGRESRDHVQPLNEIIKLKVDSKRPLRVLENLRQMRRNVNYYGYSPKIAEVNDAIDIGKSLFNPLLKEVKKIINKSSE